MLSLATLVCAYRVLVASSIFGEHFFNLFWGWRGSGVPGPILYSLVELAGNFAEFLFFVFFFLSAV